MFSYSLSENYQLKKRKWKASIRNDEASELYLKVNAFLELSWKYQGSLLALCEKNKNSNLNQKMSKTEGFWKVLKF